MNYFQGIEWMKTITSANANRNFSRLLKDVGNGHEITILSRGTPVAKIVSIKNAALHKNEMKRHLLARIKNQAVTGSRNWTRKELYDDDTCE
jgi:prevent-host-death family protein